MPRFLFLTVLAGSSLVFAQLDSNSITVTASRSVYLAPDLAIFSIAVSSPTTATLDDVLAALQGSGITAASLSSSSSASRTEEFWYFTLPTPLPNINNTLALLTKLQQTILQKNTGLKLTFNVQSTQVSPQLQQVQQCMMADLVADARARAQTMVDAAGLALGPVLAIAQLPSGGGVAGGIVVVPTIAQRTGDFSFAGFLLGVPPPAIPAVTCSITAKFSLLRYQ